MTDFIKMQSDTIGKLVAALVKAQAAITAPARNREVTVTPRREGAKPYKFEYSTLDSLIEHVRKPLTDNGLWFVQTTEMGGSFLLKTILVHDSGEWIAGYMPVSDMTSNQEMGSGLTYRKRYALAAILGLASDMDDDGNTADGNTIEASRDRTMPPKPKPSVSEDKKDEAMTAAIKFAMEACETLEKFKTRDQLESWRTKQVIAKIDRLVEYDKDLSEMVIRALHEATARVM